MVDLIQRLENLPLPEIKDGSPLDSKIANLVRVLNAMSMLDERARSCEGHLDPRKTHFPWVYLGHSYDDEEEILDRAVVDYNKRRKV